MTFLAASLEQRVARLERAGATDALKDNRIGLEKEGLRVSCEGRIAESPHPAALGSALTHPYITTDFSEALLELITPALSAPGAVIDFLQHVHTHVYRHLGDELLWATSMPCVLEGGARIPLAYYGSSNAATMKTAYRRGLGNRYGRTMQVIAGVHFNFSFADAFWALYQDRLSPDEDSARFNAESQMGMIRNLQRLGWLVPYLFGASPAVCASFVQGQETDLDRFDATTLYYPYATSLRMGDIGYQNKQEEGTGMKASYDSLDAYVRSLTWAIETPCPQYESIGVKIGDRYEQLNANVLQIENEYYSTVRPKQITQWMEKPTVALRRRGIGYVELRSLDVNLFEPVGVGLEQLYFLETLMLHCLLQESPRIGSRERRDIDENEVLTAHRGREPGLKLARDRSAVQLKVWAEEVLGDMQAVAALLDGASEGPYLDSLRQQLEKVRDPDMTPSAMMLSEMRERGEGFFAMARRRSCEHREHFKRQVLDAAVVEDFDRWARVSVERQREIERADDQPFDDFLQAYFAQSERPAFL
ncbi:glutamate--cysteine ligase [Thiorhodococcus mannitoliphagus]|uniref:Glutamate--cysteine ligase n=1 Tax=Thiorhodococcus mannitoliphagus TaxID=329406 RepID=A0A6P1E2M2_9GAMM|nr:glutamate--cysteine ligase [Thiorhodococcus mannitoliphagus]NEX22752.1 glutamate--cysteine ligase [Thiorhodococcus mannitoliphagus]